MGIGLRHACESHDMQCTSHSHGVAQGRVLECGSGALTCFVRSGARPSGTCLVFLRIKAVSNGGAAKQDRVGELTERIALIQSILKCVTIERRRKE